MNKNDFILTGKGLQKAVNTYVLNLQQQLQSHHPHTSFGLMSPYVGSKPFTISFFPHTTLINYYYPSK